MSDYKAKMQQIQFRLWLSPDLAGGACSTPPDRLAGFKGPTAKGSGGKVERGVVPSTFYCGSTPITPSVCYVYAHNLRNLQNALHDFASVGIRVR